jgi:hypothetical protein
MAFCYLAYLSSYHPTSSAQGICDLIRIMTNVAMVMSASTTFPPEAAFIWRVDSPVGGIIHPSMHRLMSFFRNIWMAFLGVQKVIFEFRHLRSSLECYAPKSLRKLYQTCLCFHRKNLRDSAQFSPLIRSACLLKQD